MIHVLVERDEVLRAAATALDRARTGRGSWLMLAAPPGRGRSAVLDAVVRGASADDGVRVRSARCAPEETDFPFALVRQVFPTTRGIPFTDPDGGQEQEVFHRLLDLLARSAGDRPVLLAVDDLHCADPVSRRWTGYLARRIVGLPVLLLATAECREHTDVGWLPRATGVCHPLPPLGPEAAAGLARDQGLPPERHAMCWDATGGNPALLQALLADLTHPLTPPRPPTDPLNRGSRAAGSLGPVGAAGGSGRSVAGSLDQGRPTAGPTGPAGPCVGAVDSGRPAAGPLNQVGSWAGVADSGRPATGSPGPVGSWAGAGAGAGDAGRLDAAPVDPVGLRTGIAEPGSAGAGSLAPGRPAAGPLDPVGRDPRTGQRPRCASDCDGPGLVRYRDAITRWIRHRADEETRRTVLALAATAQCSAATGPDLLREAMPLLPARQATALPGTPLARMLSQPLALEAVLDAADPAELAALHTRAARLLHDGGAPAPQVAARLLRLDHLREAWMARCLEDAVDEAVRAGHTEEAAALLRHVLRAQPTPTGQRHAALTLRLGSLEFPHSAEAGIRRLREGLDLHPDRQERAAAAPALGAALVAGGRTESALSVLHRASHGAAEDDELVHVLRTVTALISSHDAVAWRNAIAGLRALAPTAPATVEPLVCGLITEYETGAGLLSAAEVLARIRPRLAAAPVHPLLRTAWLGSAATLLQWADRLEDTRTLAEQALPVPPARPDLTDVGLQCLLSARAEAALWAGDFRRVIAENTELAHTCTGRGIRAPHLVSMVALARYELGQRDQAWQLLSTPDTATADSSWEWNELRHARALLHGIEGRWEAALDDHLACGTGQSARDFVSPVATPWRSGAALVLARLGRAAEARELAEEELHHARRWGTPRTVGRALRAHAAAVGGRRGLESLVEAAALLEGAPAPVERIETLIDLGRARVEAGFGRRGRDDLRAADAEAVRLLLPSPGTDGDPYAPHGHAGVAPGGAGAGEGAVAGPEPVPTGRLLRATRAALRAANARTTTRATTGPSALTGAERRVVDLAAFGHTNAQIGEALHLTRRTVESHLTSAFRKLGVNRRTQLAVGLAGTDAAGGTRAR
ncbi:LuxR C-terminal-related transcriptional regulator [Streptomyces sp. NPDC057939]|uniref:helix-turn-helix transcriptional regulator n=1 Tax=Streptomyces sp. NPDC057939 TaxID=3346284 RepID=UPI0036E0FA88